jgi:hypothetical protein
MKKKNVFSQLRVLVILLTFSLAMLVPVPAAAAGNAVVSVLGPVANPVAGGQFTVSVHGEPNNAIAGLEFNLSYDPDVITVDSVAEGNLLSQGGANTYFNDGQINNMAGTVTGVLGRYQKDSSGTAGNSPSLDDRRQRCGQQPADA